MLPDMITSASLCVSDFLTSVHQSLAYKTCLLRERRLRLGLGFAFPTKFFCIFACRSSSSRRFSGSSSCSIFFCSSPFRYLSLIHLFKRSCSDTDRPDFRPANPDPVRSVQWRTDLRQAISDDLRAGNASLDAFNRPEPLHQCTRLLNDRQACLLYTS